MDIFRGNYQGLKDISIILGFFDGIHAGHKEVIKSGVGYAKSNGSKTAVITFSKSPSEHFGKNVNYIYPRKISYELMSELGVDYIIEKDFSALAQIGAEEYLKCLINDYRPISISTGFNHTFGFNKKGTPQYLEGQASVYGYKYFCVNSCKFDNQIVSSSLIKEFLAKGEIERANKFLTQPFKIESKVEEGLKLGKKIGFPTANMKYPEGIIKIPYGVYYVTYNNRPAILNWGKKPSIGEFDEGLELHVFNFDENLYEKTIQIEILKKIRDEQKFDSIDDLKSQIAKDIEVCLKL